MWTLCEAYLSISSIFISELSSLLPPAVGGWNSTRWCSVWESSSRPFLYRSCFKVIYACNKPPVVKAMRCCHLTWRVMCFLLFRTIRYTNAHNAWVKLIKLCKKKKKFYWWIVYTFCAVKNKNKTVMWVEDVWLIKSFCFTLTLQVSVCVYVHSYCDTTHWFQNSF